MHQSVEKPAAFCLGQFYPQFPNKEGKVPVADTSISVQVLSAALLSRTAAALASGSKPSSLPCSIVTDPRADIFLCTKLFRLELRLHGPRQRLSDPCVLKQQTPRIRTDVVNIPRGPHSGVRSEDRLAAPDITSGTT